MFVYASFCYIGKELKCLISVLCSELQNSTVYINTQTFMERVITFTDHSQSIWKFYSDQKIWAIKAYYSLLNVYYLFEHN